MSGWDDYPTTLGRIISIDANSASAMVDVAGASVPAWLPDHIWLGTPTGPAVSAGSVVTLLRVLGGYQVVSAFTGVAGGGVPTLGPELLANGGFESGVKGGMPDGWTSFDYGWAISTDTPLEGANCARFEFAANHEVKAINRRIASRIDPGMTYNLSGFVSATTTSGSLNARLEVLTGATDAEADYFGGGALTVAATLPNPGAAWPALSGDFTVPVGHTYVRVSAVLFAALGTVSTVRFDALSLRQRIA